MFVDGLGKMLECLVDMIWFIVVGVVAKALSVVCSDRNCGFM